MRIRVLLLAVCLTAGALAQERPRVVRLRDGGTIFGRILREECSDEVLVMRDRRSGGKKTIAWAKVEPELAHTLRVELGFESAESRDTLRVQGHRIKNRAGKVFEGLILNEATARKDGVYRLKTAERELKIPVGDVPTAPEPLELDILVVYTPEELYDERVRKNPPSDAEGHFLIAEFARMVGAHAPAKKHYEAVLGFENSRYQPETIRRLIVRLDKLLSQAEARDALYAIKKEIVRNKFDKAQELLKAFRAKYEGDEDLLESANDLEEDAKQRRADHFTVLVTRQLKNAVKECLTLKLREPELTLSDARRYAGGEPKEKDSATYCAIQKVAEKVELSHDEVLVFWERRKKRAMSMAFCRDGTFIIVPNLKDPLQNAPKFDPPGGKKGASKVQPPKPKPQVTPDKWWESKRANKKSRDLRDWLYAWWAQEAGMVDLQEPKKETCPTCHGKGYLIQSRMTAAGNVQWADRCNTCHGALHWRIIRFK